MMAKYLCLTEENYSYFDTDLMILEDFRSFVHAVEIIVLNRFPPPVQAPVAGKMPGIEASEKTSAHPVPGTNRRA